MLNHVFMLDEVVMLDEVIGEDPADKPESLSASLERAQRVCWDSLATTDVCCWCALGRRE